MNPRTVALCALAWLAAGALVAYVHHRARMRRRQAPLRRGRLIAWGGSIWRAP
jgi:hypothetical protein